MSRRFQLWQLALLIIFSGSVSAQSPSARPGYVYLCEHPSYEDQTLYLALPEQSVERYLARGEGYHRRAQYGRAVAEFKKGLEIAPNDARLYYHLGLSHFSPRRHKEAVQYFRKALRLKPGMYMARGYMALSLGYLGQGEKGSAELAATLRVPPLSAEQWNYVASMHFFQGNYEVAIATATQGVRRFPKGGPYMARGRSHAALGKHREAIADFSTVIEQEPGSAWAWSYRADAYRALSRPAEEAADRKEFSRLGKVTLK